MGRVRTGKTKSAKSKRNTAPRIHRLNLHDSYDVSWDVTKVARDFLQNFYDSVSAESFSEDVEIDVDRRKKTVTLHGPVEFEVEYLLRIGVSTKTHQPDKYAGQFGEGFAIAALIIMRDFNVEVSARTGKSTALFYFESVSVGEGQTRELCCSIVEAGGVKGCNVVISRCPESVLSAFEASRKLFRYDGNPLFGERLGQSPHQGLYFYRSTTENGAIFYRRQKRGDYDLPFIICHDFEIKSIQSERDRSELSAKDLRKLVEKSVHCLSGQIVEKLVLDDLRGRWEKGHPLLTSLSERWKKLYGYDGRKLQFPEQFVAKTHWKDDREVEGLGQVLCASSLGSLGLISSRDWIRERAKGRVRDPNRKERRLFDILEESYALIFGSPLENRTYKVFVPENEDESFEGWYGDTTLALKESLLTGDFALVFSVFIHEGLHPYGGDGSRRFSDKLTLALEQTCRQRISINRLEERWIRLLKEDSSTNDISDANVENEVNNMRPENYPDIVDLEHRIIRLEHDFDSIMDQLRIDK